ncbi:hypothetical protein H1S01_13825 [Heliobacterium chlorum]|uniref:Uncharacterized protein n=1 Tax=Heliobacterium chlorum TaxID=2698 RepID=A0ABR7T7M6_HELCL|nr:hypothetical protein [Heliobacterium chlorum]MBC9785571.1 hypothetical protein [Heliobacterium chlorum]
MVMIGKSTCKTCADSEPELVEAGLTEAGKPPLNCDLKPPVSGTGWGREAGILRYQEYELTGFFAGN